MASDDFASRAAKLFGSLESHGATGGAWNLNTQQGFAAGAEDQDSSEDGEAGPQSLPGAAGSDEDEDEYKAKASLQYCAAFEAEDEEDAFDLVAAGEGQQEASAQRLQKNMQVLEDNAFERSHHQQCQQAEQQQQQQRSTVQAPQPQQQQQQQPAGEAMEVEGAAAPHQPADTAARRTANGVKDPHMGKAAAVTEDAEQQQQGVGVSGNAEDSVQQEGVKRMKPRGGVWVPPHRRPENRPPEQDMQDVRPQQEPTPQQQQQQQPPRGRRRVTFSDDACQGSHHHHQQQQQQQRRLPPPGGRGRGRGRGSGVPDHVANPHKYTVYELDEPLFVGQGGADVASDAVAGSWQQQQQQRSQLQQQQQRPAKARHLDPSSRAETEGPVEALQLGSDAAAAGGSDYAAAADVAAPMEVEEAGGVSHELPAAGAIKFAPTGRGAAKASKNKQQAASGAARGAFVEDVVDEDSHQEAQAVSAKPARSKGRQYRSRDES